MPGFTEVTSLLRKLEEELGGSLSAFEGDVAASSTSWSPARRRGPRPPIPHGDPYYVLVEAFGARQE